MSTPLKIEEVKISQRVQGVLNGELATVHNVDVEESRVFVLWDNTEVSRHNGFSWEPVEDLEHPPSSEAREFTETDWYGLAGCECWGDPSGETRQEPILREIRSTYLVVADAQTVQAYAGSEGQHVSDLNIAFPNQAAAFAFLRGLPENFTPESYGFSPIRPQPPLGRG